MVLVKVLQVIKRSSVTIKRGEGGRYDKGHLNTGLLQKEITLIALKERSGAGARCPKGGALILWYAVFCNLYYSNILLCDLGRGITPLTTWLVSGGNCNTTFTPHYQTSIHLSF